MDYINALEEIRKNGNFTMPPGLERVKSALAKLGDPQNKFKSIHIAGTNGKGSVCAMTASILEETGFKTGLFISPYVVNFRERIQINGEFISEENLAKLAEEVLSANVALKEFEFVTVMGFLYFSREKCDIAVIETGLGGSLDATNTLPLKNKLASVITKIGLDHTAVLGDTIEKITAEKCGIIGDKTVTCIGQEPVALKIIKSASKNLVLPDESALITLESNIFGNSFVYKGNRYEVPLGGRHQINNAVTAIETIKSAFPDIDDKTIALGLSKVKFPARLEILNKDPLVITDGAHNPCAASVLKDALGDIKEDITAVIGMMADKNCDEFLKIISPAVSDIITVAVSDNGRSISAEALALKAKRFCKNARPAANLDSAISEILKRGNACIITGSLYLAAEARQKVPEIFK